jgi:hypothetical protein
MSGAGVATDPSKVADVQKWPRPQTVKKSEIFWA